MWKCPTQRTASFPQPIAKDTPASQRPHYRTLSPFLSFCVSLSQSPPLHLSPAFHRANARTHKRANTHYSYPHCPGSGGDSFFPCCFHHPSAFQRLASPKIIPIYPTGCLYKRFRLSDSLRGMTDSSSLLFKENWIHQPLLNGCIQAFDYTPSDTLVGVWGVFNCVFAHMCAGINA